MTDQTALALPPLEITCTTTKCGDNLHCWRITKAMRRKHPEGKCIECGVELIEWNRVHRRNPEDLEFTINSLQYEFVRHHFWHVAIDPWAVNAALRLGRHGLMDSVEKKIRTRIGAAKPFRDGGQTPWVGGKDPVAYAQHATASCCRTCAAEWHGVPKGRKLTDDEVSYLARLALEYIYRRIDGLTDEPQSVPPIRQAS